MMNINSIKQKTALHRVAGGVFMLLIGMGLLSSHAHATCNPVSGQPNNFIFNFTRDITELAQNKPGTELKRLHRWVLGGSYLGSCRPLNTVGETYFKATVPNMTPGIVIGRLKYHHLNQYLQVASEVYIAGGYRDFVATPFTNVGNRMEVVVGAENTFGTGADGYISLYFTRSFVGKVDIPQTLIMEISASRYSTGNYGQPMARVYMSGSVTVPQSCQFDAGQAIPINLGSMADNSISQKGNGPAENIERVDITLACNNISEGVKVSLSFSGQPAVGDATALATTNKDIAIRVLNAAGETVTPNQSELPVLMNYGTQTGSTSMTVAPINVTGNVPEAGTFTGVATLNAEIQ